MVKRIGTENGKKWKSEDKGTKEILGLEDYGQKTTDVTKKYLNTICKEKTYQQGTETEHFRK